MEGSKWVSKLHRIGLPNEGNGNNILVTILQYMWIMLYPITRMYLTFHLLFSLQHKDYMVKLKHFEAWEAQALFLHYWRAMGATSKGK
jgi:hypothetical protein